jgi:hypothetical protein
MPSPGKKTTRLTAAQAAEQRAAILKKHRALKRRELALCREYGPLMLRWARESSGLTAFFVHRGNPANPAFSQLDGLVGKGRWAIDQGRWNNGIDIIVETSNAHIHLVRCLTPGRPTKLTNEQAQLARQRLAGGLASYPAFPWEDQSKAEQCWRDYRDFRRTDPRTGLGAF